jgi:deazaflavin-dependent oxidoreductase (nitroreductase family)
MKLKLTRWLHRYVLNPPVRWAFAAGIVPPGYAMLETIGRRSGQPRETPVGDGLIGDTFWIVAEHGRKAAYVRNLQANPQVRVRLRSGALKTVWRNGTAEVLSDDDPRERQRQLAAGNLRRRSNAFIVRAMSTELLTVKITLER